MTLCAQTVFQALEQTLALTWIGGQGATRSLAPVNDAVMPWAGRLDFIHPPRLQLLGVDERRFLDAQEPPVRRALLQQLFATGAVLVCAVSTDGLSAFASAAGAPLWHTPLDPSAALATLSDYQRSLAAATTLHGELLEVFGLGVLLTGSSGSGKSELALELISRGHRLIADDCPALRRVAPTVIEGVCPSALQDFLEVRGLGILNIRRMFGDSAIKRNKRVRLVIHLTQSDQPAPAPEHRLHGQRGSRCILGVDIPEIRLPIGRNLAVLVECAARDHIQRLKGYCADQDLAQRCRQAREQASSCA